MPYSSLLAVVMPATDRALVTLSAAATECGAAISAIAEIESLVAAASADIAKFTGRTWILEGVRETFRGDGQNVEALTLRRYPVIAISAVTVDGRALDLDTEIECDADSGLLHRLDLDGRVRWSGRTVVVEYTAGYVPPGTANSDMPPEVQAAAAQIVAWRYHARGRDPRLRSRAIEDVGSISLLDPRDSDHGFPPGMAARLEALRRSPLG